MKKLLKITALLLALLMAFSVFIACDDDDDDKKDRTVTPASDPAEAKSNLEDADYEVVLIDTENYLTMMDVDGLTAFISAYNEDDEGIMIYYFEDKDAANAAWDDIKQTAEEMAEELEEGDPKITWKKSGKMIWIGTKKAIKAAK